MSKIPEDNLYTRDHEWTRIEGNVAEVGITDHAQKELGDIVFIELPDIDDEIDAGDEFGISVALDGDTLAVGSYWEDSSQTTITNGTTASSNNSSSGSGAGYVYRVQ